MTIRRKASPRAVGPDFSLNPGASPAALAPRWSAVTFVGHAAMRRIGTPLTDAYYSTAQSR